MTYPLLTKQLFNNNNLSITILAGNMAHYLCFLSLVWRQSFLTPSTFRNPIINLYFSKFQKSHNIWDICFLSITSLCTSISIRINRLYTIWWKQTYQDKDPRYMFVYLYHFQDTRYRHMPDLGYHNSVHEIVYHRHRNENSQKTTSSFPSYRLLPLETVKLI